MGEHHHYVPILKGKQGEFRSLRALSDRARDSLTPLIEMPSVSWDPDEEDVQASSVDPSLSGLPRKLEQGWGVERHLFVDLGLVPSAEALAGGEQPVAYVFRRLREVGVQAVPVTGLGRDPDHRAAIAGAVSEDRRGVCLRLSSDDFDDLPAAGEEIDELLSELGVHSEQVDLILDFGEVSANQSGPLTLAAVSVVRDVPYIERWRSLSFAATAFPDVSDFTANSLNTSPRVEWAIWRNMSAREDLPRRPAFGDYAVNGIQTAADEAAAYYRSIPNLRYTTDTDWLVLKAAHPRHGHDQFNDLCRTLTGRAEFRGTDFSWGDGYVAGCAHGTAGPGNAMT